MIDFELANPSVDAERVRAFTTIRRRDSRRDNYTVIAGWRYRLEENFAATLDGPTIGILSLPDGRVVGRLAGHSAPVQVLAFVDEGRRLISAGNDARVMVWDVSSSAPLPGEGGDR